MNGMKNIFFDGAMGTALQDRGLTGDPVRLNQTHGAEIIDIHRQYIKAGANIITANTFGAYKYKHPDAEQLIAAAMQLAREAARTTGTDGELPTRPIIPRVALNLCPTGQMLEPYGDMTQDEAHAIFLEASQAGAKHGADIILIETFFCINELEAAVKAAKTTGLPVFATMTFDKKGRTTMGKTLKEMAELLESLGVAALGMNCGLGPDVYKGLLPDLLAVTGLPVLVQPNAGLPEIVDGQTRYNVTPEGFAQVMAEIAALGCTYLGGCCGTTPAHIAAMVDAFGARA
jgi:5-methyltetrahydrofolate--homocysteine methyltransferase